MNANKKLLEMEDNITGLHIRMEMIIGIIESNHKHINKLDTYICIVVCVSIVLLIGLLITLL